jgi:YesN/AraC family two-component response regulator
MPSLGSAINVGAAEPENGEEAFELALKHGIDLLIVDLNMPIVNGITLMKKLRGALPQCRFVIVTGYDQFAYAQEAIRLNVDDYLLKPVDPLNLEQVLEKISLSLAAEKKEAQRAKACRAAYSTKPRPSERACFQKLDRRPGSGRRRLPAARMPPSAGPLS